MAIVTNAVTTVAVTVDACSHARVGEIAVITKPTLVTRTFRGALVKFAQTVLASMTGN